MANAIKDEKIRDWKGIPSEITHRGELTIENLLNDHFLKNKIDAKARRVECKNPTFSDYDISVHEFDIKILKIGNVIIKIDVERKPGREFSGDKEIPSGWPRGVSFVDRKVKKSINRNIDVYMIHDDNKSSPKIIWAPYGWIRSYGTFQKSENGNSYNDFWGIKDLSRLGFGFDSFGEYLENVLTGGDENSFYKDKKNKSILEF
jgi:hypothetical protein